MKRELILGVMVLFLVLALSLVSAKTLIAGKIYNSDYSETISGASVEVTCNSYTETTTSLSDGSYAVTFNETGQNSCNNGSTVEVYAEKGGLYGSKSGVVNDDVVLDWDIAIVNVPLIPEFGIFVGMLTVLSALGVFFLVRKR